MIPFVRIIKYGNIAPKPILIKKIVMSNDGSIYLLYDNGDLYGLYNNKNGQMGTGNTTSLSNWTLIRRSVDEIWAAPSASLIRTLSGSYYLAGKNATINNSRQSNWTSWVDVSSYFSQNIIGSVKKIIAVQDAIMLLNTSNTYFATGAGTNNNIGISSGYANFTKISDNVTDITGATTHTGYITNGKLYGSGLNNVGQLGSGGNLSTYTQFASNVEKAQFSPNATFIKYVENKNIYACGWSDAIGVGAKPSTSVSSLTPVQPSGIELLLNNPNVVNNSSNSQILTTTDGMYGTGNRKYFGDNGTTVSNIFSHINNVPSTVMKSTTGYWAVSGSPAKFGTIVYDERNAYYSGDLELSPDKINSMIFTKISNLPIIN